MIQAGLQFIQVGDHDLLRVDLACTSVQPVQWLDPFNGLLLTPHLDLAFDLGLISFDGIGQILLGEDLSPESVRTVNHTPELRLGQIEVGHRYLAWHREHLFRK